MKQALFSFSLLFLIMLSSLNCFTTMAQAPVAAQKPTPKSAPAPKASPPSSKPLVPTSPQTRNSSASIPDDIITIILKKAKRFRVLRQLLKTTEIMNNINSQHITAKSGGLTILAPDDNAFSQLKAGFLNSLNQGQKIELLQFHILPEYVSSSNFDSLSNPVHTLAGKDPTKLILNVMSYGNSVNISTGVVNATVTGVVYSDNKLGLAIFRVDKVLLPLDFAVTEAPASAPAVAKEPKADNPSAEAVDPTIDDHFNLGSSSTQGTTTSVSLVVALVAVARLCT